MPSSKRPRWPSRRPKSSRPVAPPERRAQPRCALSRWWCRNRSPTSLRPSMNGQIGSPSPMSDKTSTPFDRQTLDEWMEEERRDIAELNSQLAEGEYISPDKVEV